MTTLRDICNWCEEEGIELDDKLQFFSSPEQEVFILSVYKTDEGQAVIDIGVD